MQALGKNLLVKPIEEEFKKGILIMPTQKKPTLYEVLSVGDEITNVAEGDKIRIFEYGIKEIEIEDGSKVFVVPIENVYAKMR